MYRLRTRDSGGRETRSTDGRTGGCQWQHRERGGGQYTVLAAREGSDSPGSTAKELRKGPRPPASISRCPARAPGDARDTESACGTRDTESASGDLEDRQGRPRQVHRTERRGMDSPPGGRVVGDLGTRDSS